jgi:hypothetical protein
MNGYLGGLISRHLAPTSTVIRPRLRSRFETSGPTGLDDPALDGELGEISLERIAQSPAASSRQDEPASSTPAPHGSAEMPAQAAPLLPQPGPPPQTSIPVSAPIMRQADERRTSVGRETAREPDVVRPLAPSPASPRESTRHVSDVQELRPANLLPGPPATRERVVMGQEARPSERRVESVERSVVAPPVVRHAAATATSFAAPRIAHPLVGPVPDTRPSVTVTIGRVDVRAVVAPQSSAQTPRPANRPAAPSLEDYLRDRTRGAPR